MPTKVLFVCLGNICRSPLAENVFRRQVQEAGLDGQFAVDSAGTGAYHVGERPDPRVMETARQHGLHMTGRARQFRPSDFAEFDVILAMNRHNRADVLRLARDEAERGKVHMLREFDPQAVGDLDVPDPYYGGSRGFENVYQIVARSSQHLHDKLAASAPAG